MMLSWKWFLLPIAAFCFVTESVFAQVPGAGRLSINQITTAGDGCSPGNLGTYISEDAQAFTLTFDNYSAEIPAGPLRQVRKTCQVNLDLRVAPGWSFSVVRTDARGYASLDSGISGLLRMYARVDRRGYFNVSNTKLVGEYFGDYEATGNVPVSAQQWSSCSAAAKSMSIFTDLTLQRLPSNSIAYQDLENSAAASVQELNQLNAAMIALAGSRSTSVKYAQILKRSIERMGSLARSSAKTSQIRSQNIVVDIQARTLETLIRRDHKLRSAATVQAEFDQLSASLDAMSGLVRGESSTAAGLMTVDTLDGEISQKYSIAWRRCR